MRFLVDECLSSSLAARLRDADHDAIHVVEAGLAGQPDSVVMEAAQVESRVLVSADTDFGELLARSNASAPSLVLYRGSDVDPAVLGALLLGNLDQVADELHQCAIVVLLDDRIRVRLLPLVPG